MILQHGSRGSEVSALQRRINALASDLPVNDLKVDGIYGDRTRQAVRRLQQLAVDRDMRDEHGRAILVDGEYGPQTDYLLRMFQARSQAAVIQPTEPEPATTGLLTITTNDIVPADRLAEIAARCNRSPEALMRGLRHTVQQINTLHPEMRAAVTLGIRDLYEDGRAVYITEGFRDSHAQNAAFRRGHSQARAGQSFHNYSLAIDVIPMTRDGRADYQMWRRRPSEYMEWVGDIRSSLHGRRGLDIIGDNDAAHYEFPASSLRGLLNQCGRERDQDGFLTIENNLIPREFTQATNILLGERRRASEPPPLPVQEANRGEQRRPPNPVLEFFRDILSL